LRRPALFRTPRAWRNSRRRRFAESRRECPRSRNGSPILDGAWERRSDDVRRLLYAHILRAINLPDDRIGAPLGLREDIGDIDPENSEDQRRETTEQPDRHDN